MEEEKLIDERKSRMISEDSSAVKIVNQQREDTKLFYSQKKK